MTKGERIKMLREKAGLTQTELAYKLKTTKQTIYKYELNIITNIPSDKIEEMAKTFGISPAYIMGWEDAPSKALKSDNPDIPKSSDIDPDMFVLYMYKQLNAEDKAEIRGEMKQMLKSHRYTDLK